MVAMILEAISRVLKGMGSPYALIGGQALAMRGHPRLTHDFDFLTTDRRVFQPEVWKDLETAGASVVIRKGDFDDPLAGVIHINFDEKQDADIIVAKWKWEAAVIERAERLTMDGVDVPVVQTSDLILLKLAAGGFLDLQDVHNLLSSDDRDQLIREVGEKIDVLQPDAREAWRRILTSP